METRSQATLRATAIKAGRLSMRHMRMALTDGRADTAAMRWGRLIHRAVLEPITLAALPQWRGRWLKTGRRAGEITYDRKGTEWDVFAAECARAGTDYLMPDEMPVLEEIADSAREAMADLPPATRTELPIAWEDEELGPCNARIDGVCDRHHTIIEVKTCANIDPRAFLGQCERLGYHLQLGWYARGFFGAPTAGNVVVLAMESRAPYCCVAYRVPAPVLSAGYDECVEIARRFRICEALGVWSGPASGIQTYERPAWAAGDELDMEGIGGEEGEMP